MSISWRMDKKAVVHRNNGILLSYKMNVFESVLIRWMKLEPIQFRSIQSLSCFWLSDSMNHSTPGLPVHHQLPEFTQTHVHQVGAAIQQSHPLSSLSLPALNLSQHRDLFKWVSSMATHSSVLAWRIPRMGEPGGLPSMGSHRVGHDWSDLAAGEKQLMWG